MGIFRLYSGDDGESHIEELDLASHPDLTALHGAKGVVFRSTAPGYFSDWHNAPRRQYIITLSGEAHVRSEHFRTAMAWMPDAIAATPEIIHVEAPGESWSTMAELQPRTAP